MSLIMCSTTVADNLLVGCNDLMTLLPLGISTSGSASCTLLGSRFSLIWHDRSLIHFSMCDTVKIISPNHHLFSPHTFDFIVNNSSLCHLKTSVKVI